MVKELNSKDLIDSLSFCVIDLETTGGNHDTDKIIEIGMVRIKERKVVSEKNLLINPHMPIPDFIQKLTSIKQVDVKDKPSIEDSIEEIIEFIGDDIIVAHNTSFDVPFLNSVLIRLNLPTLENKVICTNVMTKHMIPEIMNSNLNYMSKLFDIEHSQAHRAQDDAKATALLLLKYLDIFIAKGIKKVNQLYYPKNKFELDRAHFTSGTDIDEIESLLIAHQTPLLITIKGERGVILAVLPVTQPQQEISFIKELIESCEWSMITIKFTQPILEAFVHYNTHYLKMDETVREKTLTYLIEKHAKNSTGKISLNNLDFIISPHLIKDQLVVFSFLNLVLNNNIFKCPAQKKKMYNYLLSQSNRFESNQKGRRKNFIHKDIIPLFEGHLSNNMETGNYLALTRKEVKGSKEGTIGIIEKFSQGNIEQFNFPTKHL